MDYRAVRFEMNGGGEVITGNLFLVFGHSIACPKYKGLFGRRMNYKCF